MNPISLVVVFAAVACVWSAAVEPDNEEVMEEKEQGAATAALKDSVSDGELAAKINHALSKAFPEAKDLKDRAGSLELVIANDSKYTLTLAQEYFKSGTFLFHPDRDIAPGDATIATVAPQESSFTLVDGGMSWKIGDTGKYLTIGVTLPDKWGSYRTWIGVLDRIDAKYGYLQTWDGSLKLLSNKGFALLAERKESEIADRRVIFGIRDE